LKIDQKTLKINSEIKFVFVRVKTSTTNTSPLKKLNVLTDNLSMTKKQDIIIGITDKQQQNNHTKFLLLIITSHHPFLKILRCKKNSSIRNKNLFYSA